jgi:hypothetical protein
MEKIPVNVSVTGTFKLHNLAGTLKRYKQGDLKLSDAIWEIIQSSE